MNTSTIAIAFLLVLLCARVEARSVCGIRISNSDICVHGKVEDFCGRLVCARGPGEKCGGSTNMNGACGDGMHCICGTCNGCSIFTFECYSSDPACK